jgi:putative hemolysin
MKKLLGIIVMGLLLSGCSPRLYNENSVMLPFLGNTSYEEVKALANSVCSSRGYGQAINVEKPTDNGKYDHYEILFECDGEEVAREKAKQEKEKKEKEKEQLKLSTMINKAKSACKLLGMKEGTEKFSDCALKLYTQEIELAGQKNQQVVVQGGGSNVMTIYDPVRDNNALMKQGQRMMSGACTLGIDC